jgi:CelD/BcsL family acetyltransferase involved in cellulose biosynthesis
MLRIVLAGNTAQLREHVPAWESLARASVEPNVFYEPWMLLPAIEAFGCGRALLFVLVYADIFGKPPLLCGVFPLERRLGYRGLPVAYLRLWTYVHCFLSTPLVRRTYARQCLVAFLDWLTDTQRALMMEWGTISADGKFYRILDEVLEGTGRRRFVAHGFDRPLLCPRASSDAYVHEALPKKARGEFRRLGRRLAETGVVRYETMDGDSRAGAWVADFMALEASGWKGRCGSALSSSEAGRRFFTSVAAEAAKRRQLTMLALKVNDRPIAMKCNFLAQDGGYTFKIAHDERFSRFSPGALLELEHVHEFHRRPQLRWMDSCADPDHFMLNRLWLDRRRVAKLLTATGSRAGDLVMSSLPFLHRMANRLRARPA